MQYKIMINTVILIISSILLIYFSSIRKDAIIIVYKFSEEPKLKLKKKLLTRKLIVSFGCFLIGYTFIDAAKLSWYFILFSLVSSELIANLWATLHLKNRRIEISEESNIPIDKEDSDVIIANLMKDKNNTILNIVKPLPIWIDIVVMLCIQLLGMLYYLILTKMFSF